MNQASGAMRMTPSSSFIQQTAKKYAADAMTFLSQDPESLTRFHNWLMEQQNAPTDMMSEKDIANVLSTYAPLVRGALR